MGEIGQRRKTLGAFVVLCAFKFKLFSLLCALAGTAEEAAWLGEEEEVVIAWIAARARSMVHVWPLSPPGLTAHRMESFSQSVMYPSVAHSRLRVKVTLRLQSPLDGDGGEAVGKVLIRDVTEASWGEIGHDLGVVRLAPAAGEPLARTVNGLLYGPSFRVFVPLVVAWKDRQPVNVLFLVDTVAPTTHLRADTWNALLPVGTPIPGRRPVTVLKLPQACSRSQAALDSSFKLFAGASLLNRSLAPDRGCQLRPVRVHQSRLSSTYMASRPERGSPWASLRTWTYSGRTSCALGAPF